MSVLTGARPTPSTVQQWWVLAARMIVPTLRNGEVAVGVAHGGEDGGVVLGDDAGPEGGVAGGDAGGVTEAVAGAAEDGGV
jgi:hypothetical protein